MSEVRSAKVSSMMDTRRAKKNQIFPFIRIAGSWLNQIGFGIGQQMKVTVENGKIILEPYHDSTTGL